MKCYLHPLFLLPFVENSRRNEEASGPFETGKNETLLSCQLKKERKPYIKRVHIWRTVLRIF